MKRVGVRAAAERLGVGYSTLKRWVLDGRVRTTTTEGGHHRISETELERLAAARHGAPLSAPEPAQPTDALVCLSARNRLAGYVVEVRVDGLLAQVRLQIGDQALTAVITADAAAELKLKRGDEALAVIKSTEVMIARVAATTERSLPRPRRRSRAAGSVEPASGRTRRS